MDYSEFARIMSPYRANRYLMSCKGNTNTAIELYRKNLILSQELFTLISFFEVALRNRINDHLTKTLGSNWLRDAVKLNGIFDNADCRDSKHAIEDALNKLGTAYTHSKLVAELGFGFWRYMFASHQYLYTGRNLLLIFTAKPRSSAVVQYNQKFVFNQLKTINDLRNRIAHHEPVCFRLGLPVKDTAYARYRYIMILQLFQWMDIDQQSLLHGLDNVIRVCDEIDML